MRGIRGWTILAGWMLALAVGWGAAVDGYGQTVPGRISYQGRLFDGSGQPVTGSSVPMEFRLFDRDVSDQAVTDEAATMSGTSPIALAHQNLVNGSVVVTAAGGVPVYESPRDYTVDLANGTITRVPTGFILDGTAVEIDYTWTDYGTDLWSESRAVEVDSGVYSVVLGDSVAIPMSVVAGSTVYLEVAVAGETLTPRSRLTSVPYALQAERAGTCGEADYLDGLDSLDFAPAYHTHGAGDITGTFDDSMFSAYSDLGAEGYLDNNAPADLLTQGQGDLRYSPLSHTHSYDNIVTGTVSTNNYSAYADLGSEGYLDDSAGGDLLTQAQGDARYVNTEGDDAMAGSFQIGGNLGIGTAPKSAYGVINNWEVPPAYGASFTGHTQGVRGVWSGNSSIYGSLGSDFKGVTGQCGTSSDTYNCFGAYLSAVSQGPSYAVMGTAEGYGDGTAYGVYGAAYGNSTGPVYGGYFTSLSFGTYAGPSFGIYASGSDYAAWLADGMVYIGNGGNINYAEGSGDLYVQDELEVDGVAHFSGGLDAPSAIDPSDVSFNYAASSSKGGIANDSDLLDGQDGSFYRSASNVNAGTLGTGFYSAISDLGAEGYLDNNAAGDLLTQTQGDARFVNTVGDDAMAGSLTVGGDLTVSGNNIGIGTAPNGSYGLFNNQATAPLYGAYLYGSNYGLGGFWSSNPTYHYGLLGTQSGGVYGRAGNSDETGDRYGAYLLAYTQSTARGVYAAGYGYGASPTVGGEFLAGSGGTGPHYGVMATGNSSTAAGSSSYGVWGRGYGYSTGSTNYGGYFTTGGSGTNYGVYGQGFAAGGIFTYQGDTMSSRVTLGSPYTGAVISNGTPSSGSMRRGLDVDVQGTFYLYGADYNVQSFSTGAYNVFGNAISVDLHNSPSSGYGVYSSVDGGTTSTYQCGVFGKASGYNGGDSYGVYGYAYNTGGTAYGVYGSVANADDYAGFFGTGKVRVGSTGTPSANFNGSGDLYAAADIEAGGNFNYSSPRTQYFGVSRAGEWDGSSGRSWDPNSGYNSCPDGTTCGTYYPVNLPDRATVTAFHVWGYASTSHNLNCDLNASGYNVTTFTTMATVSSTYTAMNLSDTSIVSASIDNSQNSYSVYCYEGASSRGGYSITITGIRIDYTVDGPE